MFTSSLCALAAVAGAGPADHWSFQPVRGDISPPAVRDADWPRTPIDAFIKARQEQAGVRPAGDCPDRSWLRRVTFGLTGLPPTPAEVAAFLADDSPARRGRVVDRLLASPAYGERWGRHWLDLARFAETQGHEFDFNIPEAYRYRDYVIAALNEDVPFDRFAAEHIAGDLLAAPRRDPVTGHNLSVLGTGFWLLGEAKHSPVDVRGDEADRVDNQIDVFSRAFCGLTVACARCHDHKFDAITTADYYALAGFLQSSRWQRAFLDDPARRRPFIDAAVKAKEEATAAARGRVAGHLRSALNRPDWAAALLKAGVKQPDLVEALKLAADPAEFANRRRGALMMMRDAERGRGADATPFEEFAGRDYAGWFVTGGAFGAGPVSSPSPRLQADPARPVRAIPAYGVAHSGLAAGPLQGALRSRTFRIASRFIHIHVAGKGSRVRLIVDGFQLIRAPIYGGLQINVNHGDGLRWAKIDVGMWKGHAAYVELLDDGPGHLECDRIVFSDSPRPPAGRVPNAAIRSAVTAAPSRADLAAGLRRELRGRIDDWAAGRPVSAAGAELVDALLIVRAATDDAWGAEWGRLFAAARSAAGRVPPPARGLALADGTPERERVHVRGDHNKLGGAVPRRWLEALSDPARDLDAAASGRLALARRLLGPGGRFASRVIVNRVWHHHFGRGLVETVDDFGIQGKPPTHPELLDYLASRLMRGGWSLKRLHREVVLSRVYGLVPSPEASSAEADATNSLWHYRPARRLEAEAIRDAILAVSGRLDRRMGGRGPLPHLTEFMVGRGRPRPGPLDGDGRRSVYLNVRRNFLNPMFLAFDYPTPFTAVGRRGTSNVPAQALSLMNNPFVVQQARLWSRRVLGGGAEDADRVTGMFEAALGRPASPAELRRSLRFLESQGVEYGRAGHPDAWADLAHVVMNMKEFIFLP